MFLWCVFFDRPMCWACRRGSYGRLFRPRRLPSVSQFSRRLRTERVLDLLQGLHDELARRGGTPLFVCIDGKALAVGECTRDRDARKGRGAGKFSRGYKAHVLTGDDGRILVWHITGLNVGEQPVAEQLVRHARIPVLTLADGNYDSASLYQEVDRCGGHLLTPLKGASRNPRLLAAMPPARRRAIDLWERNHSWCVRLYRLRGTVERAFANLVNSNGGIIGLPAFVRTLPRVRRFVGAKITLYNARLLIIHAKNAA